MESEKIFLTLSAIQKLIEKKEYTGEDLSQCSSLISKMNYREIVYIILMLDKSIGININKIINKEFYSFTVQTILDCLK